MRSDEFKGETRPFILNRKDIQKGRILGKGGFGVVYRGFYNGIQVAIKESTAMDLNDGDEWIREIYMMSKLRHPHILQFYGISTISEKIILVTELCKENLNNALQERPLEFSEKISILLQTSLALFYLHELNPPVLHRYIKPEKILLTSQGVVKLADFGLARFVQEGSHTMTMAGTPDYSSPEVIKRGHYSTKSDVFGFAMIMWEVHTQLKPFGMRLTRFQVQNFLSCGKRPAIPEDCPTFLAELISECWAQDLNKRPDFKYISSKLKENENYVYEGGSSHYDIVDEIPSSFDDRLLYYEKS